jgi:excisionase family DNA binding protein
MEPISVTVTEAGKYLRCSESKVFRLLKDGSLTRGVSPGKQTLVTISSINEFLLGKPVCRTERKTTILTNGMPSNRELCKRVLEMARAL